MGELEFLFVLLLAVAMLVRVADAVSVPYPIVLVLAGLGLGLIPGLPDLQLRPEVIFLVFLPPLLHAAGWQASPRELYAERGPLLLLALGLVLVTMGAVAVVGHAFVGLDWAPAFVLGAIVAPTDPVSASATFSRLGVPPRVGLIIEGESMLNDASALVAYRVAVAAATSGAFSLAGAGLDFVASVAGGIAVGAAVGWLGGRVQDRLNDVTVAIVLTLGFAYGAYIAAEQAGVSGILATVVAGLWLGWNAPMHFDADTRLSALAFWNILLFLLNTLLFLLLGLQLPGVLDGAQADAPLGDLVGYAAVVVAVVVLVRLVIVFLPAVVRPLARVDAGEDWRERLVVGWSGMRGAISLAAVLSLPESLDERGVLIFLTVVVIAATLVGQGLTLPLLMRMLGIHGERDWSPDEAIARLEAAQAALDRLDEIEDGGVDEDKLKRLRDVYRARFRRCMAVIGGGTDPGGQNGTGEISYGALRRELIGVERSSLLGLRREGRVNPEVMRTIIRDLDLEEARLRG